MFLFLSLSCFRTTNKNVPGMDSLAIRKRSYQMWLRAEPSRLRPSSKTCSKVSGDFHQGNFQQRNSLHLSFCASTEQPSPTSHPSPSRGELRKGASISHADSQAPCIWIGSHIFKVAHHQCSTERVPCGQQQKGPVDKELWGTAGFCTAGIPLLLWYWCRSLSTWWAHL